MPARLVGLSGLPDIILITPTTVVGRNRDCEVRLVSSRISRRHCVLTLIGAEVHVHDLGSLNGIAINGKKVDRGILRADDDLDIAHLRYRLSFDGSDGNVRVGQAPASDRITGPTLSTLHHIDVRDDPACDRLRQD
jgi:pSer/pThr/pTyr-binding forkhead associated (FHA) protein